MKLCECPVCSKNASPFWNLGNGAFLLSSDKKCSHCSSQIVINKAAYIFILFLAALNVVAFFMISYLLFSEHNNIGTYLITFFVMYLCFYVQLYLASRFIRFRVFTASHN